MSRIDSTKIVKKETFEFYEEGLYDVEITKMELAPTKKNTLGFNDSVNLLISYTPLSGPSNKIMIDYCQIKNVHPESERVGLMKLSILAQVCGVEFKNDIEYIKEKLLHRKLKVLIKNKEDRNNNKKSFFYYEKYTEDSK